jgi:hypothetical protein
VPEVEIELRSNRKYGSRLAPAIQRTQRANRLRTLDYTDLSKFDAAKFNQRAIATAVRHSIQRIGDANKLRVDTGEAYSHAAAVVLGTPLVSNDFNAIRTLVRARHDVAIPTLRFFDIVCFGYWKQWLTEAQCNRICKDLRHEAEHLPKAFAKSSFKVGLGSFSPRLVPMGQETDTNPQHKFQEQLAI